MERLIPLAEPSNALTHSPWSKEGDTLLTPHFAQGHNYLKQEDSSPRSMASVPSAVGYGSDTNLPPDQRTLQDLEPNPTFDDYEDQGRINRIYGAMMDMTSAQDNGGMKKTWIALSKGK